jgi:hypothetical protein
MLHPVREGVADEGDVIAGIELESGGGGGGGGKIES